MHGMANSLNAMEQETVNNDPLLNETAKLPRIDGKADVVNFKGHSKDIWLACQEAQATQVAEKEAKARADKAFDRAVLFRHQKSI